MSKLRFFFVACLVPFVLSACQTSQVGTSSFAGSVLSSKPVKKRASVKLVVLKNEAASSAIKPGAKRLAKKRKAKGSRTFVNEAASSAIKPSAKRLAKKRKAKGPRVFVNEASSSAVKPVRRKKASTKASRKRVSKVSKRRKKRTVVARASRKRGGKFSSRRSRYRRIIAKHARANGVPVRLAMAVVQVESAYRASARGAAGEIGLMQLMPRTARHIGYKGPLKRLYNPDTNVRYGMKYLGKAYKLGGRSVCGAILKYNAGHGAKRMNPISRKYCKRVRRILRRG